jgi:septum formation protein
MITLSLPLILGSTSPRRKVIFDMIGLSYKCARPLFEENLNASHNFDVLDEIPEFFAIQKALSLTPNKQNSLVISYDTAVFFEDKILGKPASSQEAYAMLTMLNGQRHRVITGVALVIQNELIKSGHAVSEVDFASSSDDILKRYAWSEEPKDKAGSYAIQGKGAVLVEKINGCYYNVMGAPLQLTLEMLKPYFK